MKVAQILFEIEIRFLKIKVVITADEISDNTMDTMF